MSEEIITLSPDRMGYKDRGKMKWIGMRMMLSDHVEALKKMYAEEYDNIVKEKAAMDEKEISELLYYAYVNKLPIALQAAVIKNGSYYPDVIALVLGYNNQQIILEVRIKDGNKVVKRITIDQIRNVELYDILKFNNKKKEAR